MKKLTAGQRVVLGALEEGRRSVGVAPGALGRIVASLHERGWAKTTAMSRTSQFGDLQGWTITDAGRKALERSAI